MSLARLSISASSDETHKRKDAKSFLLLVAIIILFNLAFGGAFLLKESGNNEVIEEFALEKNNPSPARYFGGSAVLAALVAPEDQATDFPTIQGGSLVPASLSGALIRKEVIVYEVELGDTASEIAAKFGVSTNSILWSNSLDEADNIFPGQELVIPPVSGLVHKTQKGDNISSIALRYNASIAEIIDFNNLKAGEEIDIGDILVVPNGKITKSVPSRQKEARSSFKLLTLDGYFINPTLGTITQGLHPYNAIDIANGCGTAIYASAQGIIAVARDAGWNGGAGKFVQIKHPNGLATLYAHLSELKVGEGETVDQGETIGLMGHTGRTIPEGPAGCHLHFSVYGAKNPLAR